MLKIDGHDNAVIGTALIWANQTRTEVLVYDGATIVGNLVTQHGMTLDEAHEYIDFNIEGAYVGDETPVVMWKCDLDELE
jgi:hypothetical protein